VLTRLWIAISDISPVYGDNVSYPLMVHDLAEVGTLISTAINLFASAGI